ncbi:uncharacterized protein N7458_005505 [Penicillium daleae]|uniref:FAD-binding PCMH-type domain-containing protein n=1 Tax=Penicillium daleae TaxID=63821 RepID=A0AAD6CAE9_9EURO|nr:uncharacterized protein N7458_005505 [Penicillium daleae]KAJ5454549.1 hypothetical protein N7458_005505 [Penicillium daleae]
MQGQKRILRLQYVLYQTTGPQHGYSITLDSVQNGLEINTAFLNHLSVDPNANTPTAGGSVTFGQAIDALYSVGKEMQTGSFSCVGLLGGGLGGGVGRLSGLHGLVLESLMTVRLMLPNTTIITASKDENEDIFCAIRGAGFNFGYVLNATYRIYDQVPNGLHLNADFKFPISQVQSYYERLDTISKSLPKEPSILTLFNFDADLNETVITANAVYAGPEADGRAAVQFLLDQNPLWAIGVNRIDPDAYTTASGILAVPDNETAYPWRSLIAHALLEFKHSDANLDAVVDGYARRIRDVLVKTAGTARLNVYVSYSHGDETLEEVYGEQKLGRLAKLKQRIDPDGLFDAYHALPMAYP